MNTQDQGFQSHYSTPSNYQSSFEDFGQPKKPKKSSAPKILSLFLACTLVGGGSGVAGAALYSQYIAPSSVIYQSDRAPAELMLNPTGDTMTPAQLYQANLASTVGITVSTTVNVFGQISTSAATGSGFVLTQDGYIVTNHHVIADAALDPSVPISVSFADGTEYPATLIGFEPDNDIAVLKVEGINLQPVTLGDSDKLVVGEPVMAIGNPLGELTYSLTDGIVSALDRLITAEDGGTMNMLQTNTAINPGNSGGPLFNSYGEVIGITTAKYTTSSSGTTAEGLGFAIPINDVKNIINDLIDYGYVTGKPYMGVQVIDVPQAAQQYGVSAGASVEYVATGSSAERGGLLVGDIITAIDDTAVDSNSALTAALSAYRAKDSAQLSVVRNGQILTLDITFDEKNDITQSANTLPEPEAPYDPFNP